MTGRAERLLIRQRRERAALKASGGRKPLPLSMLWPDRHYDREAVNLVLAAAATAWREASTIKERIG